jgi:hypothetical protein
MVITKEVDRAVPVKCMPDLPPEPAYPDTAMAVTAAPDIFERVKLLLAGRVLRTQREQELTKALDACRG